MIIKDLLKKVAWKYLPFDLEAKKILKDEQNTLKKNSNSDLEHLKATAGWLLAAQDSGNDNGVSRSYKAVDSMGLCPKGWQASYPETTGYIIPTMFELSNFLKDDEFKKRALKMADWEIEIQMPSGAVMGSVVTAKPSPAVFNTGQVIFGWLAAFKEVNEKKYLDAAFRAGDYLVSIQDEKGTFLKGDSNYALKGATTYNTRVAWALIELGLATGENSYRDSGTKNINYILKKQHENGWFADNCLSDPNNPLLHTIVYNIRGILESGISLDKSEYKESGLKSLDSLIKCQRDDGGVSGRLNKKWEPMVDWDCVTGDAQLAIALLRAHAITGNEKYKETAGRLTDFIKKTQDLNHPNPGIRGGVKGSFPFDGEYGKFQILNWAAKFFCDSLMLKNSEKIAIKGIVG